ncbi:MAG: FtsH protease activity modulator HflK [Xanthobacteraceae bacterium]|nr:FtsH protease activity modulator HflK [Xanthobacteraceae bacterium]MBX3533509.1 FtsH protease activity modulator HflK [Xanthobacteraceae bacterium]MBX3550673.1 FtsH protease activity modulator HflK [Xanthobacteraceae bacterium]MCW5675563.1 FtsH protease activity modulator HflK [Xanthobacteraceae bacterium]MCW5676449.1 FtsH protease activity modulator HflK [Xanthobacteraceae bacterium]
MSWKNQSGGPWGGGPRGPWGSGPQQGPGRGGNQPPDLEDLIRRGQDRLKSVLPGSGNFGSRGGLILLFAVIVIWLLSGFYRVNTDEQGIVLRFGKFVQTTQPGLNYHLPYPIETALTPRVTFENKIDIGFRQQDDFRRGTVTRDVPEESLILTGDENIVDVDFSVFWIINDAGRYLFNLQNPEGTIKAVAESAMREVIGRAQIQPILTGARAATEQEVLKLMQKILDSYQSGITVTRVQMQKVDPPSQVIDAFRDVQAARADAERLQNEAQTYANRVVPEARGEAARILQAAEAYKERTVVEAKGQAARFLSILTEYKLAPDVTRRRMYLETMERVLGSIDKVILDPSNKGSNVVPYLPLDQLLRQQPQGGSLRR